MPDRHERVKKFTFKQGHMKSFELQPGTYTVESRAPDGKSFYQERINVLAGKTIKIHPDLPAQP